MQIPKFQAFKLNPPEYKLLFQQATQPSDNNLGTTLCPTCHRIITVSIGEWIGTEPVICHCGWKDFYSFQAARAAELVRQLTNYELAL